MHCESEAHSLVHQGDQSLPSLPLFSLPGRGIGSLTPVAKLRGKKKHHQRSRADLHPPSLSQSNIQQGNRLYPTFRSYKGNGDFAQTGHNGIGKGGSG